MDYNFMVAPDDPPPIIGVTSELPQHLGKFTPKMFLQDVGKAYKELGGLQWLIIQAKVAPAEFMKLLQKMMPKTLDLDLMEGTTITLIDRFSGQSIEIAGPSGPAAGPQPTSPLLPDGSQPVETDTSGSPDLTPEDPPPSGVTITDTFPTEVIDA